MNTHFKHISLDTPFSGNSFNVNTIFFFYYNIDRGIWPLLRPIILCYGYQFNILTYNKILYIPKVNSSYHNNCISFSNLNNFFTILSNISIFFFFNDFAAMSNLLGPNFSYIGLLNPMFESGSIYHLTVELPLDLMSFKSNANIQVPTQGDTDSEDIDEADTEVDAEDQDTITDSLNMDHLFTDDESLDDDTDIRIESTWDYSIDSVFNIYWDSVYTHLEFCATFLCTIPTYTYIIDLITLLTESFFSLVVDSYFLVFIIYNLLLMDII